MENYYPNINWKDIYDTDIKITEEAIENSSAKLIPANCVIVAMYGATAAKVAINKIPLSTNSFTIGYVKSILISNQWVKGHKIT